ncbi:MAG: TIGR01777 family oxidoreductase [Anaerolineae bacterium]|nr:TIGR01777 family oxidoreductase [Anaerolineae bacterium]
MRVVITGGSGLIGRGLVRSLSADGHESIILSRSPGNVLNLPAGAEAVYWDGETTEGWGRYVDGADAVVNLAGESIAGSGLLDVRWTSARRRRILESRITAGRVITAAIKEAKTRPGVLLQASAVGYYPTHTDDRDVAETDPAGRGFLADVVKDWEASTKATEKLGVRRVLLRTGVVLSPRGGALPRQMLPFKFFAGGPLGSGEQWFPWIHLQDHVAAMRFLMAHEDASGVFNLSAPNPVRNAEFSKALGKAMGRPSAIPVPAFVFELMFGEAATVLLEGQKAVPKRLQELGFTFEFPEVGPALEDLLQ